VTETVVDPEEGGLERLCMLCASPLSRAGAGRAHTPGEVAHVALLHHVHSRGAPSRGGQPVGEAQLDHGCSGAGQEV